MTRFFAINPATVVGLAVAIRNIRCWILQCSDTTPKSAPQLADMPHSPMPTSSPVSTIPLASTRPRESLNKMKYVFSHSLNNVGSYSQSRLHVFPLSSSGPSNTLSTAPSPNDSSIDIPWPSPCPMASLIPGLRETSRTLRSSRTCDLSALCNSSIYGTT